MTNTIQPFSKSHIAKQLFMLVVLTLIVIPLTASAFEDSRKQQAREIIQLLDELSEQTRAQIEMRSYKKRLLKSLKKSKKKVKKGLKQLNKQKLNKALKHFKKAQRPLYHYNKILGKGRKRDAIALKIVEALQQNALNIIQKLGLLISGETSNIPPQADAGNDQSVQVGDTVTLDASASSDADGDSLTYYWQFITLPETSSASFSDEKTVTPTFVVDIAGQFVIELTVSDSASESSDTVIINVDAINTIPLANAGSDQSAQTGAEITLDGSASSDADGDALSYHWLFTEKPLNSNTILNDILAISPVFTADLPGQYNAQLIVNDGEADSEPDSVSINVENLNTKPVADAGADQSAETGELIQLDGSQSSDADQDSLTYLWTIIVSPEGSSATINDRFIAGPTITPDIAGQYVLQLVVNDDTDDSEPDSVILNIAAANTIPLANAGTDQTAHIGDMAILDGTASSDADGDPLSYLWSLTTQPEGSIISLSDNQIVNPTLEIDQPGHYIAQLIVNDGQASSNADEIIITTINSRPVANAGEDQTIIIGETLQLDGSQSTDADGDNLSYQWSISSQPIDSVANLSDNTLVNPQFNPDQAGEYVIQLIVSDGTLESSVDAMTLQVEALPPLQLEITHPAQDLATNQETLTISGTVNQTATVTLNGEALTLDYSFAFTKEVHLIEGDNSFNFVATIPGETLHTETTVTLDTVTPVIVNSNLVSLTAPTADGQVTISGAAGSAEPGTQISITNIRSGEVLILMADSTGAFSSNLQGIAGDSYSLTVTDSANNISEQITITDGTGGNGGNDNLPDDPKDVAPELNPTKITTFADTTKFLYTSDNPIQTGVAPDTIDASRIAIIRGKVMNENNAPLTGVIVSIKDHTELGQTLSRADGMFDLAVNGGGLITLNYSKSGYLPVQRQVKTEWKDFFHADDVVMIQRNAQATSINLSNTTEDFQVAQGSINTDVAGTRQITVLFPKGTSASMTLPDGTSQPLNNITVRLTEYTTGENGPLKMPGPLPPASAYTYAVELGVDEAVAAGADTVNFSQKIPFYVDNFLNFPAGEVVPVGFYDGKKGLWVPSENGIVIKIISITDGIADIDVTGDDVADTGISLTNLGISDEERIQLASLYARGKSLWRVQTTHFTPGDINWPVPRILPGAISPDATPPNSNDSPPRCPTSVSGCIIEIENQVLGEDFSIIDTPYSLHYRSSRAPARKVEQRLDITISGESVPDILRSIELTVEIAGQQFKKLFPPIPNQHYKYEWDGLNAYGLPSYGINTATVTVNYRYDLAYGSASTDPGAFGRGSPSVTAISTRPVVSGGIVGEIIYQLPRTWRVPLSNNVVDTSYLGHVGINVHHAYNIDTGTLFRGDGAVVERKSLKGKLEIIADSGSNSPTGSPFTFHDIASDGNLLISNGYNQITVMSPDGSETVLAGLQSTHVGAPNTTHSPTPDEEHDEGRLATNVTFGAISFVSLSADGTLHFYERQHRDSSAGGYTVDAYRYVTPEGILRTHPLHDLRYAYYSRYRPHPDGSFYITNFNNLNGTGHISRTDLAGNTININPTYSLSFPTASIHPNGSVFIVSDSYGNKVVINKADGTASELIVPGLANITSVNFGKDEDLYFVGRAAGDHHYSLHYYDGINAPIRISGDDSKPRFGSNISSTDGANIEDITDIPWHMHYSYLYGGMVFYANGKIWLLRDQASQFTEQGENTVPSEDGSQLFIFDQTGKHLRTLNATTGSIIYQFHYNTEQQLIQIEDLNGKITSLQRDATGLPETIISTDGKTTLLTVDSNGYLDSITSPGGGLHKMTYNAGGLLTNYQDPNVNLSTYGYNEAGQLITDDSPEGTGWTLDPSADGKTTTLTSKEGRVRRYFSELLPNGDRNRSSTNAAGISSQSSKLANGKSTRTAANGTITQTVQSPDPRFGMQSPYTSSTETTLPSGLSSITTRNRSVTLSDPADVLSLTEMADTTERNGKISTRHYDAATKTTTYTSPEGRTRQVTMDDKGRTIESQITGLQKTQQEYDSEGRLKRTYSGTGADLRETSYSYYVSGAMQGNLETITDSKGQTTHYSYDPDNRLKTTTLADLREINYDYDANSNLIGLIPDSRPVHEFNYNGLDQEISYTPPELTGIVNPSTIYDYNKDRQLTTITRPDGNIITHNYNPTTGRLDSLSTPQGDTLYGYHPSTGQLNKITTADNQQLDYTFDGFLTKSSSWTGDINGTVNQDYNNDFNISSRHINDVYSIDYSFDKDQLPTKIGDLTLHREAQKGGLLNGTTLGQQTTTQSYTPFAELETYTASYSSTTQIQHDYSYDKLSRIKTKTETIEGISHTYEYSYDPSGRLETVKKDNTLIETYGYDSNNNRTHKNGAEIASYDDQDRLLNYNGNSYTHTANGELETKTQSGATTSYSYDVLGNLRQVALPGDIIVEYIIDGQNRRIGKKVNNQLTQGFLYKDQLNPIAELNANNEVVTRFVYAEKGHVPSYLIKIDPNTQAETTYRVITDHLGSPRLIVNNQDGTIEQQLDYDTWGNVTQDTNPGFQPFGFAGGLYDQHTKLVRFGARDYDAGAGRWTAKDPIRFEGGDSNLYGYVVGDPVNLVDPAGKEGLLIPSPICLLCHVNPLLPIIGPTLKPFEPVLSLPEYNRVPSDPDEAGDDAAEELQENNSCPVAEDSGNGENCREIGKQCKNKCIDKHLELTEESQVVGSWVALCYKSCMEAMDCSPFQY